MTLLEAIRKLLLDADISPVFLIPIPANEAAAVSIRGPYQSSPVRDFTGVLIQRFQCYVRAITQKEAETLSRRCFNALMDKYPQADIEVNELIPIQGPTWLGRDSEGRHEYVFNFEVVSWVTD
jgi:hypothetical protein